MKYTFAIIALSAISSVCAQEQLTGTVVDENNQSAIGVSVFWENTSIGVTTDSNGHFSIPFQSHSNLIISYVGYQSQTLHIHEESQKINAKLVPDTELEEVLINTKQRNTVRSLKGTTNSITMNSGEL
jgi:hypothetical protein